MCKLINCNLISSKTNKAPSTMNGASVISQKIKLLAQADDAVQVAFDLDRFRRYLLTNRYLDLVGTIRNLRQVERLVDAFAKVHRLVVERTFVVAELDRSVAGLLT